MTRPPSQVAERARALLTTKQSENTPTGDSESERFLSVLVESAYLIAAADGVVSPTERQTLAETIAHVLGDELPPGELVAMIDAFAEALAHDGRPQRLVAMAHALPDAASRREALSFAALIALCDRELVAEEREALDLLGASFGLDQHAIRATLNEVADSLASAPPAGQ